jgi:hypothetical protein
VIRIIIRDSSLRAFDAMIQFIYTERWRFKAKPDTLFEIFCLADKYMSLMKEMLKWRVKLKINFFKV